MKISKFDIHGINQRGLFIAPDMTMRGYLKKYPLAALFLDQHLGDDRERLLDATILDFLKEVKKRPNGHFMRDMLAGWINNIAGAYYHAPLRHDSTDWLHTSGPAPAGFWTRQPLPVELSADGIGIRRPEGLQAPWYWACNGAFSVRYSQAGGAVDSMSCWNWKSGPRGVSEQLFKGGFLSFGIGRTRHAFQDATLWPYGFRNRWGGNGCCTAELHLEGRSMALETTGSGDAWIELDWNARKQMDGVVWKVKGWDESLGAFIIHVAYMHNSALGSKFYPPYPDSFSLRDILSFTNGRTDPGEDANDYLSAGNLYFLIRAGKQEPRIGQDGIWRWSQLSGIRLQISAGTTFNEAVAELRRAEEPSSLKKRCLAHYRQIRRTRATVRMPGHRNIETISATAPLLLETLKLEGNQQMRHSAGWSYADTHTSLMSMDALLYGGDVVHVENFLTYLSDPVRRGPKGQISTACHYDGMIDICQLEWKFHDTVWLALIGRLHWHRRGAWPAHLYESGRRHALRILSDTDPDTALFTSHGYWPDMPLRTVGRKGAGNWPAQEAGTWYEALRTFETLALDQNDSTAARRFGAAARKLRHSFQTLFFEPSVGFICDHVQPVTKKRHPHYSSFHLYFLDGMFGHELLDAAAIYRMADVAYAGLHDSSWKFFRTSLQQGPYHSELEFNELHWFLVLAKLFRRARHSKGLLALRESLEFHYGKLINYLEAFNMQPDMTVEQHDFNGWFNNCMSTRCRVIIEGLFGVSLSVHNLTIHPVGLDTPTMALENLPVGTSRWSFRYSGCGEWPSSVKLDGRDHSASWVFPERLLDGGKHLVAIAFTEQAPSHPVLLETAGLRLKRIVPAGNSLTVFLAGPGRAEVCFLCPHKPGSITVNGKPVRFDWNGTARHAVVPASAARVGDIRVAVLMER
ncbi:MAG: hypothetical protein WAX69_26245 [Victivallales bacterium]